LEIRHISNLVEIQLRNTVRTNVH